MKTLVESIFGDNVKSNTVIQGEEVDDKIWKQCEDSFEWFRDIIIDRQKKLKLENIDFTVLYDESDCVILIDNSDDMTIVAPETIWYSYIKGSLKAIQTSGIELTHRPRPAFFCMSFAKKKYGDKYGDYYNLEYTSVSGYEPITISDKAKKIIKKH